MKRFLFLLTYLSICFSGSVWSQNTSRKQRAEAWRKIRMERKAQDRALEAIQDSASFAEAVSALQAGSWVLEADNVTFRNGLVRYVSSNTNFVAVNEGQGTVQTAFNNFVYSPNGIGGVTVKGSVSGMTLNKDCDGNWFCNFAIQGVAISAQVNVSLTGGTNQASVYINPNFSGNTLTMNGSLVPYESSDIFQGTTTW